MANEAMVEAWNGDTGERFLREQARYDRMMAPWGELLADVAAVRPGERVLDVGCGAGATTLDAAARTGPGGAVLGVDLSRGLVERARERAQAAGHGHVRVEAVDAQSGDVGSGHDVVISRFGVMFFEDPVAAFAHLGAATRPGGRLAALSWAGPAEQEWLVVAGTAASAHLPPPDLGAPGTPGMFGLAEPDRIRAILHDAGWVDVAVRPERRPTLLGAGTVDDAVGFVAATSVGAAYLDGAPDEAARAAALGAVRDALADHLTADGVSVTGTALAVTARRPAG